MAKVTLDILGAAEQVALTRIFRPAVAYGKIIVKRSSVNRSALSQDIIGNGGEHPAGGALHADFVGPVFDCIKYWQRRGVLKRQFPLHRATFFAQATFHTSFQVNFGIREPFLVRFHNDRRFGTKIHTGHATAAFRRI